MKKNRFALWILTFCVMFTTMVPTANAAEYDPPVMDNVCICLNDNVMLVNCFIDENDDIRVKTVEDLYRVLPDLEEAVAVLPSPDGHVVVDYFDFLEGYTFKMEDNCLFIYTDSSADDNDYRDEDNGYCDENNGYCDENNGYLDEDNNDNVDRNEDDDEEVIDIRPIIENLKNENNNEKVSLNVFFNGVKGPWSNSEKELKDWATNNGYLFRQYGNNVYLNNDGNTPIIIKVNGKEVDFPDQQPLIINPGRTMVPIRAITDCIGDVDIDWNGEDQRVTIQSQYNKLVLWIGNSQYWYNGQYYKMDVTPCIMNGRTMVPIRFIAEAFGFVTTFDDTSDIDVVSLSSGW